MSTPSFTQSTIELSLPSELGYEVVARDAVAAFARRLGIPSDRIEDLKTALSEACINAIEHGNSLKPGLRVQVNCRVEEQQLVVEVIDQGVSAFAPHGDPPGIAEKIAGLGSPRGMGLMLISQLCDESGFVAQGSPGNCFRFSFHRAPLSSLGR
jgi:serine/threonine-protein kinase RsbW